MMIVLQTMMLMTHRQDIMGQFMLPWALRVLGWLAAAAMAATVIALVVTSFM